MLRVLLACVLALSAGPTFAAESFDGCAGTITSLPATINTQGVWCLRADLSTAVISGAAITITTNNVTLDCNGFKLGGLGGGLGTTAQGVLAFDRSNLTVRNCSVRGFLTGIYLLGGSGHVIENNRLDGNTNMGIRVNNADAVDVRHNFVANTGGSFDSTWHNPSAIDVAGGRAVLVRNNFVVGVAPDVNLWPSASAHGIFVNTPEAVVTDNHVSGLANGGAGYSVGIRLVQNEAKITDNTVSGLANPATQQAFNCGTNEIFVRNLASSAGSGLAFVNCTDDGGNIAR